VRTKTSSEINRTSKAAGRLITQKHLEGVSEASLQFEPNAGIRRRFCRANDHPHIIAVTAERLDAKRVYLGAPEAEGRYDMQTGEMPTVRPKKMQSAASRALRALR
jgi:hypothetical protein